jgi:tetratricopeptide (TPR) repeat protein
MKDYFDLYKTAKEKIYYRDGLVAVFLLLGALFWVTGFNPISSFSTALLSMVVAFMVISGWLFIRRVPRFKQSDIGILFAPYGDEDVLKDIDRLHEELSSRIKSSPMCKRFVLKTLPPNRVIKDVDTAMMIRKRSRCLLLIWGRYEKGQYHRRELRGFRSGRLNFTYAYPRQLNQALVKKDITTGIVDRAWMFASENDLIEREFVISNIYDVSRYIIGTCFLYFGLVSEGKEILVDIIKNPSKPAWKGSASGIVKSFLQNLRSKISRCDALLANDIYQRYIFVNGKLDRNSEKLSLIVNLADASLSNDPNADAYTVRAIAHFLQGDIAKAKRTMAKLRRREPLNPSPCYSLGFLFAYEGDLRRAEQYYRQGFDAMVTATPDYIFHLSEFVEAVLEQVSEGDHYHLHYVAGLIHKELIDKQFAKSHFEKFLSFVHGNPEMNEWEEKTLQHMQEIDA